MIDMQAAGSRLLAVSLALGLGLGSATAGPAVNQFEVKDLEVEQGEVEIEVQSDWAFGHPDRKFVILDPTAPDMVEFDDNEVARQRHEIAIGFGLADWLKIGTGVEFEEERVDDPASFNEAQKFDSLKATEIGFEGIAVLVPVKKDGIGLGVYAELQLPMSDEARSLYVGPIVQAVSGPWSATGNFAFVKFMGGAQEEDDDGNLLPRDEKWDFAYFSQIKYDASENLAFAVEAYGTIDRLGNSGNASEAARAIGDQDQHRIGPAVYYTFKRPEAASAKDDDDGNGDDNGADDDDEGGSITLCVGVLFGLNEDTPDTTLKTGLEVEF